MKKSALTVKNFIKYQLYRVWLNKHLIIPVFVLFIILSAFLPSKDKEAAPTGLLIYDGKLFIAEELSGQVTVMDLSDHKIVKTYLPGLQPVAIAICKSSGVLFVCGGGAHGKLAGLNIKSGELKFSVPMEHTPCNMAMDNQKNILYVANRFSNSILEVDALTGKILRRMECVREPVALALAGTGSQYLLAGNHLPLARGTDRHISAEITIYNTSSAQVIKRILLPNGSTSLNAVAVSGNGQFAYFTHILARFTLPTTQVERGWMNTAALSIIDCNKLENFATVLLDDTDLGFANPRAIYLNSETGMLAISSFGTDEVIIMNEPDLHRAVNQHYEKLAINTKPSEFPVPKIENNLSFCSGFRQRIQFPGRGARSLIMTNESLYVGMYYSDEIIRHDLKTGEQEVFPITTGYLPLNDVRQGEALFNDAKMCFQHWQSCESCHPDARVDALSWDLLNDGFGNPKDTKSMLYAHITPPSMSLGVRSTAEQAVRAGMRHILFAAVDEEKAGAIDVYLKSLRPVTSPYLKNNKLSKSASRGKGIFEREGCAACHPPPFYSDLKEYDVKSGRGTDKDKKFDTPTLVEAWRTAPYMHDGSAQTMGELIPVHNPNGTSPLTEKELEDLAEFLLSL